MLRLFITIISLITYLGSYSISEEKRQDLNVLHAMEQELTRSIKKLELEDYIKPYFISYLIKDNEINQIIGRYGAIMLSENDRSRQLFVDVRVGDYDFDNSDNGKSGGSKDVFGKSHIPIDNDIDAIRSIIWQATDSAYKKSLTQYFNKKAKNVQKLKKDFIQSFSKEKPYEFIGPEKNIVFQRKNWREKIRKLSSIFKEYAEIYNSSISFTAQKETIYFTNSEGGKYITDDILYSIYFEASTISEDGNIIKNYNSLYYKSIDEIPNFDALEREVRILIDETYIILRAKQMNPINVPSILEPEAAGIMFHEAVGHRLEGERQIDDSQGQTFAQRLGSRIIPDFLTIIDDHTLKTFNDNSLLGFFVFDDQGIEGSKVTLVKNGILKNYLLSRTPIKGFNKSNGHGRASYGRPPMARMSNLIIKSQREYTREELKELLIEEVKKQNKEFGLIIKKMIGGETNTSSYDFQAYKATPLLIHRVDPHTGKETPVRGVEIVGTPLISINKIIATGNDYKAFNGFCGAESGYVPVSTIAPSILISEIELQKTITEKERKPILKPPFSN